MPIYNTKHNWISQKATTFLCKNCNQYFQHQKYFRHNTTGKRWIAWCEIHWQAGLTWSEMCIVYGMKSKHSIYSLSKVTYVILMNLNILFWNTNRNRMPITKGLKWLFRKVLCAWDRSGGMFTFHKWYF